MNKSTLQSSQLEVVESLENSENANTIQTLDSDKVPAKQQVRNLPSYHPTAIPLINAALDFVDKVSGGRAAWFQRFVTYLIIGGTAALVNLAVFYLVYVRIPLPVSLQLHNLIASVLASEISIMANFIPNDYFTFRHLAGHERTWIQRCIRFHITSIGGALLTFLIEFAFHFAGHVPALVAQATALILVLIYNFTFHHLFTYRHVKQAPKSA